jgi:hypothetical protein
MLSHQSIDAYAAVSPQAGKLDSLVLPEVNGQWMQRFVTEVASRYSQEKIVKVVDTARRHKSNNFAMPINFDLPRFFRPESHI